ncbi:hypothetical protein TNCV_606751 [Trichonephila clavipes]|nr:hypothetical protein TNCV_606751 [Trichonephila clavipes]
MRASHSLQVTGEALFQEINDVHPIHSKGQGAEEVRNGPERVHLWRESKDRITSLPHYEVDHYKDDDVVIAGGMLDRVDVGVSCLKGRKESRQSLRQVGLLHDRWLHYQSPQFRHELEGSETFSSTLHPWFLLPPPTRLSDPQI